MDSVAGALDAGRAAAGGRDVRVMGGAAVQRQFLAAGLVDELVVHLVPVLLKAGTPLFQPAGGDPLDLEIVDVVATPLATHLHYRVG